MGNIWALLSRFFFITRGYATFIFLAEFLSFRKVALGARVTEPRLQLAYEAVMIYRCELLAAKF